MSNENEVKETRPGFLGRLFGRGAGDVAPEAPPREEPPTPIAPEPPPPPVAPAEAKQSWWKRLSSGLSRSSSAIGQGKSNCADGILDRDPAHPLAAMAEPPAEPEPEKRKHFAQRPTLSAKHGSVSRVKMPESLLHHFVTPTL